MAATVFVYLHMYAVAYLSIYFWSGGWTGLCGGHECIGLKWNMARQPPKHQLCMDYSKQASRFSIVRDTWLQHSSWNGYKLSHPLGRFPLLTT